ncbi:hypothetical protein [Streptomyces sp. NRRL B-3648]|uniref:hypothetical protein n=1 Tax=Streptomyces sp. NRRL B-3648 TaxID=1519493 RepID=UPI0006B04FCA|nr:hypothetical protein [Streptomyces sp. NRRL B-3648]KOX02088.1 hypothetical protein ADL04_12760 [Streptomyces sp. NRRL B-3648]
MAWDEWEQLKADARADGAARMRLNHVADPVGGGGTSTYGDLKVSNADLAAIGKEAHALYDQLWNKARVAQPTSESAAGDLAKQGFTLGRGLKHVAQRWDDQLRSLLDACAQISNHLHVTKRIHSGDDGHIGRQLSSIDTLDAGFDDRAGEPGRKNPVYYPEKKD